MNCVCQSEIPYLFDFDGTLVDTIAGLEAATNLFRQQLGLAAVSLAMVKSWIGGGLEPLLAAAGNLAEVTQAHRELFYDHYVGAPLLASVPYSGIENLLNRLIGQRPLVIVTNKNERSLKMLVEHLVWERYFDAIVCPDNADCRKPDRAVADVVWQQLGIRPKRAVMFGDSEFDIEFAHNAQLVSVACAWGYRDQATLRGANPDLLLSAATEIDPEQIDRLVRQ